MGLKREKRVNVMMFINVAAMALLWFHGLKSVASFIPTDNYLIDCGSVNNTTVDGRNFSFDSSSSSPLISTNQHIFVNAAKSNTSIQVPSDLYLTARAFTQESSYSFNIQLKGRHWVRLYFFPVPSPNYNLRTANFTVATQNFVLLRDFGIRDSSYVSKEYLINITSDTLIITFAPSNNSIAYVNAIEVVSVPDNLISDTAQLAPLAGTYQGLSTHAFETIYRLNMGGPKLTPSNDTLCRTWEPDLNFLVLKSAAKSFGIDASSIHYGHADRVTEETAPKLVYATVEEMALANVSNPNFNISWKFTVDSDYTYFIRMHFCDIVSRKHYLLYFNVYINTNPVLRDFDISSMTNALAVPCYVDFVANVSAGSNNLNISIGPSDDRRADFNAILNGLEIMKMKNSRSSLDGFTSAPDLKTGRSKRNNKVGPIVASVVGAFISLVLLTAVLLFCRYKSNTLHHATARLPLPLDGRNSRNRGSRISNGFNISSGPSSLGRHFTFAEIREATNNFDENLILGVGDFGKVFKGVLEDGTPVAVKRGNTSSQQGLAEFRTEIELLSKLRHRHLVSLIGHCEERCEMILVYEYMSNGSLSSRLYGSDLPTLSWKQRLEICIGSARGLHYLHSGAPQGIIHRDVKTTNILLDENLLAKLADFGLSKILPAPDQTHVSTAVKGSFGYLDPEYLRREQLTKKSDVYSFGVVLLEVLCARPVIDPSLPSDQVNMVEWAMRWQTTGMIEQIIDPHLTATIDPNSLRKFAETAEKCLAEQGIDRPTMGDVLWNLEYALQLQDAGMLNNPDENSTDRVAELALRFPRSELLDKSIMDRNGIESEEGAEDPETSAVSSELVNS